MSIYICHENRLYSPKEYIALIERPNIYTITGYGDSTADDDEEDWLIEHLAKAVEDNDYRQYEKLVVENERILNGMMCDFWKETFAGDSHDEILFWINFPSRRLSIHDLLYIKPEFEDLFHLGLKRKDLDLDGANEVIEDLKDRVGCLDIDVVLSQKPITPETSKEKAIILSRIEAIEEIVCL